MLKPLINFDYWGLPIYNIMGIIGFIFAIRLILKKEKTMQVTPIFEEKINLSFIAAGFSSLVFANVANWFLFPQILNYPIMQRITLGGFSFYYGMLGFFGVSALLLRLQKVNFKFWINEIVPSVLIFHAFGRIGCSLAGCCYGKPITPFNLFGLTIDLFPAREIEALCLFILFFIFKYKIKKNRFFWYLICYSILRFFLEFGRGDDRGHLIFNSLSPAQVTSIFIWVVLLAWGIYKIIRRTWFENSPDVEDKPIFQETMKMQTEKPPKKKKLFRILLVLLIIFGIFTWWNPLNLIFLTDLNFSVMQFVSEFSKEKSVVTQISNGNGTNVLPLKTDIAVKSSETATSLINSLDVELNGTFTIGSTKKLPSGNSLYIFEQIYQGIPIYGTSKQLAVNNKNEPLYATGETKIGINETGIPSNTITEQQAKTAIQNYFNTETIEIKNIKKYWYYYPLVNTNSAYKLVYVANVVFSDYVDYGEFSIIVDSVSGEIYDIISKNNMSADIQKAYTAAINLLAYDYTDIINKIEAGKLLPDNQYGFYFTKNSGLKNYYTGYEEDNNMQIINRVFAEIMKSKHFSKDDLTSIFNSTYEVANNSNSLNYWLFRSIMIEECSSYYLNNGFSANDAKKRVKDTENAFNNAGINGNNKDTGIIQLEMKDSLAATKGKIAYPNAVNIITATQKAGVTQSYEIKSDVPVSVTVINSRNQPILTLPVYDAESFKINPTDKDETYTIFIKSGNVFYKTPKTKSSSNSFLTIAEPSLPPAENEYANALNNAYYNLTVKPIAANITENTYVNDVLKKIKSAYETDNLNLFINLIDPTTEDWAENYAKVQGMLIAAKALNSCAQSCSTQILGEDMSFDSIGRALIAAMLVLEDTSNAAMQKLLKLKGTSLNLTCYQTEEFEKNTIAHLSASIIDDKTGQVLFKNDNLYLSFVQRSRFDVSALKDVPIIGNVAQSAVKGWFIDNVSPQVLKQYGWDSTGKVKPPPSVKITTLRKKGEVAVTPTDLALFAEMSYFPFSLDPNDYLLKTSTELFPDDKNMRKEFEDFKKNVINVEQKPFRISEFVNFAWEINGWTNYTNKYISMGNSYVIITSYVKNDTVVLAIGGERKFDWSKATTGGIVGAISKYVGWGTIMSFLDGISQWFDRDTGDMQNYITSMFSKGGELYNYKHVYVTGHSFGGFVALYAADMIYRTNYDGYIDGIATFNAMPVSIYNNLYHKEKYKNNIYNYFMKGAFIELDIPDSFSIIDWISRLGIKETEYIGETYNYGYEKMKSLSYPQSWGAIDPSPNSIERFYQPLFMQPAYQK